MYGSLPEYSILFHWSACSSYANIILLIIIINHKIFQSKSFSCLQSLGGPYFFLAFTFLYNILNQSCGVNNPVVIYIGNAVNLQINVGKIDIFIIWGIIFHKYGISLLFKINLL